MIILVSMLVATTWMMPTSVRGSVYYEVFYNELTPYGTWMDTPEYGYVWVPNVEPDFQPYRTAGYWAYSTCGWTWVSNYTWGWAPFHYGRWYYDEWQGWVWVPGNEWAPAWVSWRSCDGYYGWAPLAPRFQLSMSWDVHVDIPWNHWVFISSKHFGSCHQDRYYSDRHHGERLYRRSHFMESTSYDRDRNVRYYRGPDADEVGRTTGRKIKPLELRNSDRPGQTVSKNRIEVYRPSREQVEKRRYTETSNEHKYTPPSEETRERKPPVREERRQTDRTREYSRSDYMKQGNQVAERVERKVEKERRRSDSDQRRNHSQVDRNQKSQTQSTTKQTERKQSTQTRDSKNQKSRTNER